MLFVYLRDPDGHRVEVFDSHYQTIDIEIEPVRWDAASLSTSARWGLPAWSSGISKRPRSTAPPLKTPPKPQAPMTLESLPLEPAFRTT